MRFHYGIRHEIGHAVEAYLAAPDKYAKIVQIRTEIMRECGIMEWTRTPTLEQAKAAGNQLSYYALKDDSEMIAESVAEYLNGNPRDRAISVVNILLGLG